MNRVAGLLPSLLRPLSLAGADEKALVANVTQMRKFVHERRCGGDFCDGYLVVARDNKLEYLLICATDYYDGGKPVPAPQKASCRAVSPGQHLARTDDEDFFFTEYTPKAKYSVYSENSPSKRMKEEEQVKIEQLEAEAVQLEKDAEIIRASMSSTPSPGDYEQLARVQSQLDQARDKRAEANYRRKMADQREAKSK